MSIPPSSCPARCDVDGEAACVAASIDPITLRPRRAPASILEPLAEALRRLRPPLHLFADRRAGEGRERRRLRVALPRRQAGRPASHQDERSPHSSPCRSRRTMRARRSHLRRSQGGDRRSRQSERARSLDRGLARGARRRSRERRCAHHRRSILRRHRPAIARRGVSAAMARRSGGGRSGGGVASSADAALDILALDRHGSRASCGAVVPAHIVDWRGGRCDDDVGAPLYRFLRLHPLSEVCPTTCWSMTHGCSTRPARRQGFRRSYSVVTLDPERDTPEVLADCYLPS